MAGAVVPASVNLSKYNSDALRTARTKLVETAKELEVEAIWKAVHGWEGSEMCTAGAMEYWRRAALVRREIQKRRDESLVYNWSEHDSNDEEDEE